MTTDGGSGSDNDLDAWVARLLRSRIRGGEGPDRAFRRTIENERLAAFGRRVASADPERARLRDEIASLEQDLRAARREMSAMTRDLLFCRDELRHRDTTIQMLRQQLAEKANVGVQFARDEWRELVSLVHPDIHSSKGERRRLLAEKCTKLLLKYKPR